jgi:hypothetical protein
MSDTAPPSLGGPTNRPCCRHAHQSQLVQVARRNYHPTERRACGAVVNPFNSR